MGRYIIRRVVLILPTMFLVLIIAFFLSKMVPGDTTDAMLLLQGVHQESKNYPHEYQKLYISSGFDKPLFYFSIIPHFYPDNLNKISSPTTRNQIIKLLRQKKPYADITDYIKKRDAFITQINKDTTNQLADIRQIAKDLNFVTDISEIGEQLHKIEIQNMSNLYKPYNSMFLSFEKLKNLTISFFYPRIIWCGFDNQFHTWAKNMIKGDFGKSTKDGRSAMSKIGTAINWTILLLFLNLIFTLLISVPSGLYSGYFADGWYDRISNVIWILLFSIPVFWLASMLIIYFTSTRFGAWMNIFPAPGLWYIPDGQPFIQTCFQYAGQLVLPVICLAANDIAQVSSVIRNNVVQQKSALYVRFAKSKGLTNGKIMMHHILPNVLIPLVTIIGGRIPSALSGALVIEVIFNIPGMGRLMMEGINSYDWNVVFGILVIISFFTIIFMVLTDITYHWVNPKMKNTLNSQ